MSGTVRRGEEEGHRHEHPVANRHGQQVTPETRASGTPKRTGDIKEILAQGPAQSAVEGVEESRKDTGQEGALGA